MVNKEKAQISTEYLILVGFITFVVISILGIAFVYTAEIKDAIKINQINRFADKLISSSESIFFAGEPSQIEITSYLPLGVQNIQANGTQIVFTVETSTGVNVIAFPSRVYIEGDIHTASGVKSMQLVAQIDRVTITIQ